jgi:predicted metal-dependent phosphoesterase TrpH
MDAPAEEARGVSAAVRVDLHTHSDCSDGVLSPTALVEAAAQRQVGVLALTDHDTVAGCDAAAIACRRHGIHFLPGVELTCGWRGREIHVVGLSIDTRCAALQDYASTLGERRRRRIDAIGARLTRAGLPGEALATAVLAAHATPTRSHLARGLVAGGFARDETEAFDRWLGSGAPGHVSGEWPEVADATRCITAAGGLPVLAHPHRYRSSLTALRELCAAFKAAGGVGIEVSLAGMGPGDAERACSLARRFDLAGSIGSDFHVPGLPWRPLGRFAKLPDGVTPITARLPQGP